MLFRGINIAALCGLLLFQMAAVCADTVLSGYASIVAGRASSGDEFLADYPKAGVYDEDWSLSPDTSIGVQLKTDLDKDLMFVIQATSNGAREYDVELDWAYLSYQLNAEFSIQAGRKRLPLYYYSDFFDVGYVYHWIRVPVDNYTWQISNYNGINLQYQSYVGEWDVLVNLYTGREDSDDNDLLSLLSDTPVDETWKNMLGLVVELSGNWMELRTTYMQGQLDRSVNGVVVAEDEKQVFSGISVNFNINRFILLSELNRYERDASDITVDTNMLSFGYHWGKLTPHITRSSLEQKHNLAGGDECHTTHSVGVRWDYNDSTAFKIQYDRTEDNGIAIPVLGDAEMISLGMDFVF